MAAMQATAGKRVKRGAAKKAQALVRGEPVVRGVLSATLEELGHVGYRALRIEDVATRAGVNKTTIYRRWPTKEDLVRAALLSITSEKVLFPDTGSLRGDLLAFGRTVIAFQSSPEGQSLFQLFLAEGPGSELVEIARSLRQSHEEEARAMIERALARGELAPSPDPMLPCELLGAYLQHTKFADRRVIDDAQLVRVVDMILLGVLRPDRRGGAERA